jgi:hypothetical protein
VWLVERDQVIENNVMDHSHGTTVLNSRTCLRSAYRYMFRVLNGGPGQTGIRKKLPECVESGIRALFPHLNHIGFKEE